MLKREISYEDFNGQQCSEVFYFNMSKPELIELEVGYDGGFGDTMQRIFETKDNKKLVEEFKRIVLMAYGVKSEDGKRFIKSDQLREEFSQTAAYNALFMELATNENAAADFINAVVPADISNPVQDKPIGPPPSPQAPQVPTQNVFDPPKE